ncbi:MAG: hypothetical protein ACREVK_03515, partial [Gammaproteobacteria bacterium]
MFMVRRTRIRRVLAALFVVNRLLPQLQTLFACELLDSQPHTVCCCAVPASDGCQMGGGCKVHDGVRSSEDCCQVLVDKLSDVVAAGAVAPGAQAGLLDQLPLTLPRPDVTFEFGADITRRQPTIAPSYRNGDDTYLITNRL